MLTQGSHPMTFFKLAKDTLLNTYLGSLWGKIGRDLRALNPLWFLALRVGNRRSVNRLFRAIVVVVVVVSNLLDGASKTLSPACGLILHGCSPGLSPSWSFHSLL